MLKIGQAFENRTCAVLKRSESERLGSLGLPSISKRCKSIRKSCQDPDDDDEIISLPVFNADIGSDIFIFVGVADVTSLVLSLDHYR